MFGYGKSSYDVTAEEKAAAQKRIADEMAIMLAESRERRAAGKIYSRRGTGRFNNSNINGGGI